MPLKSVRSGPAARADREGSGGRGQVRVGGVLAPELLGSGARGGLSRAARADRKRKWASASAGEMVRAGPSRWWPVVSAIRREWDALVADRVQPGAGRGRFGGQPGTGVR